MRAPLAATLALLGPALLGTSCGDAPIPTATGAALASRTWRTLDGKLEVDLPMDLMVQPQTRAVLGTSSDGGFRFYLGVAPEPTLPEQLGAMKDELIGLGWEIEGEQHFESAVRLELARGKKPNRLWRGTWIVSGPGGVLVCEGIARDAHRMRLDDPLRATCQAVRRLP
ncbi:MAG: hypothetical protein IT385_20625 [Deltaproteobacteria bacterium]|nr:hypothetical protein [Deltaproteobacteria bacterium]